MSDQPETDVLIIGGGITGLAAAWTLAEAGKTVTLLEASDRIGGMMQTLREGDWQAEIGPNTLLARPALYETFQKLGLSDSVILANGAQAKRYIAKGGRLHALPRGPLGALASPLARPALPALLRDLRAKPSTEADESIAGFACRHFGAYVLRHFVDPFVSGTSGGDPARLSVRAVMPRLVAAETAGSGSVVRGMMAARRAPPAATMPDTWKRALVSFPQGMQQLPRRLAEKFQAAGGRMLTNCAVAHLTHNGGTWQVVDQSGQHHSAKHVLLATPAHITANLIEPHSLALADDLRAIPSAPMVALSLGFAAKDVGHTLDGFGGLIPRSEGRRTLGVLFASSQFPGRAPEGHHLLSIFLGGRQDDAIMALDDDTLVATALQDLRDMLDLRGAPQWVKIQRMPHAIPQYEVGHLALLQRIDSHMAGLARLSLAGSWRGGISVGDCLASGQAAAQAILDTPA
ncbi:oxygen-dependent protoporphyrinogen oxidase [Ketogulonicigenium robustum]|uniref:Oxygen-dependent protoporphyrinogen oxidase n=1 Tax=Ketogulonicigenium robustum TaxID=92947 RepID=A0A1W6NX84_9RHOB|nr:protoporphyrinogen oxidase [Ketogulonicigenium robustum]ARO13710.1 oxygen-dependent protoporphyrinogen oxidase [Ketogulonicigenium robustum]